MFKKTKLAAAMLAVVATSAQAVHVNPAGVGQVLIYPYYNVNNGFQTQLSVINTTSRFTAVKVRFRESGVSNDVLDFNLYLSPKDIWTATVRKIGDKANLITADKSCTLPPIPENGVDFISAYDATSDADAREGYVEFIEMGRIIENVREDGEGLVNPDRAEETDITSPAYNPKIVEGIVHIGGVPVDCGVVASAWLDGGFTEGGAAVKAVADNPGSAFFPGLARGTANWTTDPFALRKPTGGLAGNTILLNTVTGSAYVIDPVAIGAYAADAALSDEGDINDPDLGAEDPVINIDGKVLNSNGAQHYLSDDQTDYLLPSLASGNVLISDRNTRDHRGVTEVIWPLTAWDYGMLDTNIEPNTKVPSGMNPFPMAAALQIKSFAGEYFIEEHFDGATDWIVTMPMKKHGIFSNDYVNEDNNPSIALGNTDCEDNDPTLLSPCLLPLTSAMSGGVDDVQIAVSTFNREEQVTETPDVPPGFSPPIQDPAKTDTLTREVNILGFSSDGSVPANNVLGSDAAKGVKVDFEKGWSQVTYNSRYDLIDAGADGRYEFYWGGWQMFRAIQQSVTTLPGSLLMVSEKAW